jgi:UDP-N-acetylglucosamine acyltransferase
VVIEGPTRIGAGNRFFSGAVIGSDPQDMKYAGEPTRLRIGDGNVFREQVTVNRGTVPGGGETVIGGDNLFMAGAHVAHDCRIGDGVIIANGVLLAGHVHIEDHAGIGGVVGVHHFVTIGRGAFVGGFSAVRKDVPPYLVVEGSPIEVRGVNVVGLQRWGFSTERIAALQKACRKLFGSGLPRAEAIRELRSSGMLHDDLRYLIEFLERSDAGRHGRALETIRASS